jgi:hypothetical protein
MSQNPKGLQTRSWWRELTFTDSMVTDAWTPLPLCKTFFCPVLKPPSPSLLAGSSALVSPSCPLLHSPHRPSVTRKFQLLVPELSNSIPLQDSNVRNGLLMQEHANPTTTDVLLLPNEGMLPLESNTHFGLNSF